MNDLQDFMCKCSPEGLAECTEIYDWAMADLESEPWRFLTDVVYALQWAMEGTGNYAHITSIDCDQWASIDAEFHHKADGKVYKAWVQCDMVEHGLARIWKWAKEG